MFKPHLSKRQVFEWIPHNLQCRSEVVIYNSKVVLEAQKTSGAFFTHSCFQKWIISLNSDVHYIYTKKRGSIFAK